MSEPSGGMSEPWIKRGLMDGDEDFIVATWMRSYCRSREGKAAGADVDNIASEARKRFWDKHAAAAVRLLRVEDTRLLCDPHQPGVIWAWSVTSGDVVHYVLVKRSVERADPEAAREMVRELLGERLDRPCAYTFFPRELALLGMMPRDWYPTALWLAERRVA